MDAQELTSALAGRWIGNSGEARCPSHPDKTPSLGIRDRRAEKQHKKKEQRERESLAANFSLQAQDLACMLVDKSDPKFYETPLAERTEDEIDQTLRNFDILYKRLRGALLQARQSHSDNVTLFPPKPRESKS